MKQIIRCLVALSVCFVIVMQVNIQDDLLVKLADEEEQVGKDKLGARFGLVEEELGEIINYITPEKFGAVGDGTTNDSVAFQSALNFLRDNGGGKLLIKGKYKLLQSVSVYNNTEILGENGTIFGEMDSNYYFKKFFIRGSNIRISGLDLDGFGIDIGRTGDILSNVVIEKNKIKNVSTGIGMYAGVTIANLKISNNELADQVTYQNDSYYWQKEAFGLIAFASAGINLENVTIEKNIIRRTATYGIYLASNKVSGFKNVNVAKNDIQFVGVKRPLGLDNYESTTGIYGVNTDNVRVMDNIIKYCNENGIEGRFQEISRNLIEETGFYRFNMPLRAGGGSASIYTQGTRLIKDNILKNHSGSGTDGSLSFEEGNNPITEPIIITGNQYYNEYKTWSANTFYSVDETIKVGKNVYKSVQAGTTGESLFTESKTTEIMDGTVKWQFVRMLGVRGIKSNRFQNIIIENNLFKNLEYGVVTGVVSWPSVSKMVYSNNIFYNVDIPYNKFAGKTDNRIFIKDAFRQMYDLNTSAYSNPFTVNPQEASMVVEQNHKYLRLTSKVNTLARYTFWDGYQDEKTYFLIELTARASDAENYVMLIKDSIWTDKFTLTPSFKTYRFFFPVKSKQIIQLSVYTKANTNLDIKDFSIKMFKFHIKK